LEEQRKSHIFTEKTGINKKDELKIEKLHLSHHLVLNFSIGIIMFRIFSLLIVNIIFILTNTMHQTIDNSDDKNNGRGDPGKHITIISTGEVEEHYSGQT